MQRLREDCFFLNPELTHLTQDESYCIHWLFAGDTALRLSLAASGSTAPATLKMEMPCHYLVHFEHMAKAIEPGEMVTHTNHHYNDFRTPEYLELASFPFCSELEHLDRL